MYNVSFGSNYRFDVKDNFPSDVYSKLYKYELKGGTVDSEFTTEKEIEQTGVFERVLVSVPDQYDADIEVLLANRGIDFHKQTFKDALDPYNIVERIKVSKYDAMDDCYLVDFFTSDLNDLFKKDGLAYIEPGGTNGIENRYERVGEYLKTGKEIDATRVYIREEHGKLRACIQDGRHRFAYLRDMGIKKIPVAIDEESYKVAVKHGLI